MAEEQTFDVTIVGAGPAGSSCALALRKSGLRVALLDKKTFPRYKCCGDAIPTLSLRYLAEIDPTLTSDFEKFDLKHRIYSTKLYSSKGDSFKVDWKLKAYNSQRIDFDNYLIEKVKENTQTALFQEFNLKKIQRVNSQFQLTNKTNSLTVKTKLVVGCDGANSIVKQQLGKHDSEVESAVAVSAIYENVNASITDNEIFFLKNTTGYFWVFPVGPSLYNVGYGLLKNKKSKHPKLKEEFESLINSDDQLSEKFKSATRKSQVRGHELPLGGKKPSISGNAYLLAGDAANLVDPLSGHGIDKAIKSGHIAAKEIIECFERKAFDPITLKRYDEKIYQTFLPELKRNYKIMKFCHQFPRVTNLLFKGLKLKQRITS